MSTKADINWIVEEITQSNDPSVIQYIKNFLLSRKAKPESVRISIEQYNREVEASAAQYDAGKFKTDEEFEREMSKW